MQNVKAKGVFLFSGLIVVILFPSTTKAQGMPKVPSGVISKLQGDGVWRFDGPTNPQPSNWQIFRSLFSREPSNKLPFKRSVAFLVGVGAYEAGLPQLPYVESDLDELRNFLLTDGGFDTVFEVRDKNVTRTLIEDYMVNKFARENKEYLGSQDRLLFYYSGHGTDQEGHIGYLLFAKASSDNFAGDNVLPLHSFEDWATVNVAKHLLIILDACASGLAVRPRGQPPISDSVVRTLSGEGSGFLLTAGSGDQEAWEIEVNKKKGFSVFTHALLEAWRDGEADPQNAGFFTVNELFGHAEKEVGYFDAQQGKKMVPQLWALNRQNGKAKGTFVFLNPKAKNPKISPLYEVLVGAQSKDGSESAREDTKQTVDKQSAEDSSSGVPAKAIGVVTATVLGQPIQLHPKFVRNTNRTKTEAEKLANDARKEAAHNLFCIKVKDTWTVCSEAGDFKDVLEIKDGLHNYGIEFKELNDIVREWQATSSPEVRRQASDILYAIADYLVDLFGQLPVDKH